MPNMQKDKTIMREAAPDVRNKNWEEVALGYTAEEAVNEAKRCLNCKNHPCMDGCPVAVRIPEFLGKAADGDFAGAFKTIAITNSLAAVCGRVCPQENQCEGKCVRGIKGESVGIGRLERFCADFAAKNNIAGDDEEKKKNGFKVAVIGSGPAGLTCASDLNKLGYDVTVFEALHAPGGVLTYGIPEFRLPKSIVKREVKSLEDRGVEIRLDSVIGRTFTIDELFEDGYKAAFVGTGAGLPGFLGIEGENANGVYSANEFLTRVNLMKAYREDYDTPLRPMKKVGVVGGGNVAMDAARCALRLGAEEVTIIYRRSDKEMPARAEEVHHAKQEGVIFRTLTNPVKINADEKGNVISATCQRMELGEPDEKGRRRPSAIEGSEFDLELDAVVMAVGTSPNPLIRMTTPGIEANARGCLTVGEDGVSTTREGVFAGGDAVSGAATVILAMGAGKEAAAAIDKYVKNKYKSNS